MGFFQPSPPPFDLEEWKAKPFLARLKPVVQDWAVNGFGAPGAIYLIYVVKLVVFVLGAALVVSATTPGIGGLGAIEDWWFELIVFQKVVAWTMLWEILGLGSGVWLAFWRDWQGVGIWTGLTIGLGIVALLMLGRWVLRERFGLTRLSHG